MKTFKSTLHEEVFSRKIGENPPLILKAEEVPIIGEILDESGKAQSDKIFKEQIRPPIKIEAESDDEVKPENYLFSNDT
jgi:hypothetical protein